MEKEQQLLEYYDVLMEQADLKFQGMLLNPQYEYKAKLQLIQNKLGDIQLERAQLARLYYWLTQKFQRMQKSQREAIPDKFKSAEFKQYEKWEREYDPARHSIYTAKKLSEQDIKDRDIQLP